MSLLAAPCRWCGYNGTNYYQRLSHSPSCRWYDVGGEAERLALLGARGCPDPEPVHAWFELSYAQYLTVPRSILEAMPVEWQVRFATCLRELDDEFDWRPKEGRYWCHLKDGRTRFASDPLMEYRHPNRDYIESLRHRPLRAGGAGPRPPDLGDESRAGETPAPLLQLRKDIW